MQIFPPHQPFGNCCVCGHQLITAFEKAMVLMDPVPGEQHMKVSADYVKCLSKVSAPYLMPKEIVHLILNPVQ